MITISLCMIVKNEEEVLERCLQSVKEVVDEIVIVDTGSTDKTKEIAKKFTEKVYDFNWIDDFSAARNFSFAKATMDYQMWLDADDILPREEGEKLLSLKKTLKENVDMVTMKYHTHFDKDGTPVFSSTRERLLKRSKNFQWLDPIHEHIPLSGAIEHSDITVWHKKPKREEGVSTRNLDIYKKLERSGKKMTPRQIYYFARECKDHMDYIKASYYFEKFLADGEGWVEDNIATCFNLAVCYRALKEEEKILPILLKSFTYDSPRAEICCEIAYYYKRKGDYEKALHWFQVALQLKSPDSMGFVMKDYWGYIPSIEACVCCVQLGDYKKAREYNKLAGEYKPQDSSVLHNERYLKSLEE